MNIDAHYGSAAHGRSEYERGVETTARAVTAAVREPWPDRAHRP